MNKLVAILLLWLPFSVTSALAVPIALFAIAVEENVYAKDVLRAMDRLGAALLGWSGRYTVSAECGASKCAFCALICKVLDMVQKGHCQGAAAREGNIPQP